MLKSIETKKIRPEKDGHEKDGGARNKVLSGFLVMAVSDFSPLALSVAGPIKGPLQNV